MSEDDAGHGSNRVTPLQRQTILDDLIRTMTAAGYHVVSAVDHVAVLEQEGLPRVEIFVDGYGRVRHT